MIISMFAIRHMPTGNYLLMGYCQSGRGSTAYEPGKPEANDLPRVFRTAKDAQGALRCWVRGRYQSDEGAWNGQIRPVPSRDINDMQVVPITLELP